MIKDEANHQLSSLSFTGSYFYGFSGTDFETRDKPEPIPDRREPILPERDWTPVPSRWPDRGERPFTDERGLPGKEDVGDEP